MATLLSYALTNLSDVKESLGIASIVTSYDNLLIRKINQATKAIENYTGRRIKLTTYTNVEYSGTYTDQLVLRQRPVTEFTMLGNRDTSLNEADWNTIDTNLYFIDANAGIVDLTFGTNNSYGGYRVSYTAGYGTIPDDLAEACASLACYYFNNRDGSQIGVTKKKEGQREVNYSNNNSSSTFNSICSQLGIDGIIASYSNNPIMTNR